MQAATLFLQETLINFKTRHFHSSVNHREQLFHRTLIPGYFRLVNIAKFLRTGFFIEHFHKQPLQVLLKVLETLQEGTCVGVSFKNLQAEGLQLHKNIRLQHRCFPVNFAKFLRTPFLAGHPRWLLLHFRWLLLYFFFKVIFKSYFATLL